MSFHIVEDEEKPNNSCLEDVEFLCESTQDESFNNVIGCLEDMLLDDDFLKMQNEFMEKYWQEFDDTEENKLIYTEIFDEYQRKLENFIVTYLENKIKDFHLSGFIEDLLNRKSRLEGEIFEMLFTLTDFVVFKNMILDYKLMKEGRVADFSEDICITHIPKEAEVTENNTT